MTWIIGNKPTKEHRKKISIKLKGIKRGEFSEAHRRKLSEARKKHLTNPENHNAWKGAKASYRAIHGYIVRHYGKATKCEVCFIASNRIHWANLDHKYNRKREDWKMMCAKCHGYYDKVNNLRKKKI